MNSTPGATDTSEESLHRLADSPPVQQEQAHQEPAGEHEPRVGAGRARLFSSPREATILTSLLLVSGTLLVYQRALQNGFVSYDDPEFVTENPIVRQGLSWRTIAWAFRTTSQDYWHPLTWISHMADVQLFGLNPVGHHLDSVFLHALNVMFFFLILRKATGYIARSAVVAGLFALLPLNVESIAWVAERKTLLCTTALLLTMWAYGWYAKRPSLARYLAVIICFVAGLSAKPMLVTVPFALLLVDFWPLRRIALPSKGSIFSGDFAASFRKLALEKAPLLALSATISVMTIAAQRRTRELLESIPLQWRVENALSSYALYIVKVVWPARLAVLYPFPSGPPGIARTAVAAAAVIALIAITALAWRFREKTYLLAGWLWYLGTLVPVIGFLQDGHQAMADRYVYFSCWGLFVAAVWLVADIAPNIGLTRSALASIAGTAIVAYACLTFVQIGYWKNNYALYSHALAITRQNPIMENDFGASLVDMGQFDLAAPHFQAAVEYMPDYATAHYNLGSMLQRQNRLDAAMSEYTIALRQTHDPIAAAHVYDNIAALRLQQLRSQDALAAYDAALRANPYDSLARTGRGILEFRQANVDAALPDLSFAVQLNPGDPLTCYWLGRALEDKGDLPQAAEAYETALRLADADASLPKASSPAEDPAFADAPALADAKSRLDSLRAKLKP